MFTKLAPHEDVGENVTFMARFIILPTHCRHAVEGSSAAPLQKAAATAVVVCMQKFSTRASFFTAVQETMYVVQKCVTS